MADIKTPFVGGEDSPDPILCYLDVEANTQIEGGRLAWSNASGNAIPSSAATASSKCWGVYTTNVNNLSTNTPYGAAGAQKAEVRQGVALLRSSDGTAVKAAIGTYVYLVGDSGTTRPDVSTDDAGGTRPLVGCIVPMPRGATAPDDASMAPIRIAGVRADANNPELAASRAQAFKARAVATSIAAYAGTGTGSLTASANGAIGTQDGVTLAANDTIVLPKGLTNVTAGDEGPWVVTSLGGASAKFTLRRPDWWSHGSTIVQGAVIEVGGEGATYGGSAWKSFAATGKVVDTDDPVLWPDYLSKSVTFASGTMTAIATWPIRTGGYASALISNTGTAAHTSTRVWRPTTFTAGNLGTSSLAFSAESAPGTVNTSDVGVYTVAIQNW